MQVPTGLTRKNLTAGCLRNLPTGPGMRLPVRWNEVTAIHQPDAVAVGERAISLDRRPQNGNTATQGVALSVVQERLWVLERLHPGNWAQNVAAGVRLKGSLESERLREAWFQVFQRHEILRTEFRADGGTPKAVVVRTVAAPSRHLDLGESPRGEGEARLEQIAGEQARQPFELSQAPLLRALLVRVADDEHVFLLVGHRMVCDAASLEILLAETAARYRGWQDTAAKPETGSSTQYSALISGRDESQQQHFTWWKEKLEGAPSSLDLSTDRARPAEQTFRGAAEKFSVEKSCLDQLRKVAESHDSTLFATLLAVFYVLLWRYSQQEDIVVGMPVSGRNGKETENIVGPLENMVALRVDMSGAPTFRELLGRVDRVVKEALAHQDTPLEFLLNHLPLERDLSRTPLFQVTFGLREEGSRPCFGEGVGAENFEIECGARFDLSLNLVECDERIDGGLSYNTGLWDRASIRRMAEHFRILGGAFAANPALRVSEVSALSEAERHKILVEFNANAADYRRDLCIHNFFEEQAERTPEAVALVCGVQTLSYRELNTRANALANYLRARGVGPEVLVGICGERTIELLVGILGILKAGGAYVPLDPAYPKDRLAVILEDAKAPVLLTQSKLKDSLPTSGLELILLDSDWPAISSAPATAAWQKVAPNNLGYVLFTSGSTGRPKGVALKHRSAAAFLQWAREVFRPEEIAGTLLATSVCFDLSVFEMFVPLSMGGKVIIAQNALELPRLPAADQVTLINTVPSAIAELVRMGGVPASVKVVNLAGEALPTSLAQQIYEKTSIEKLYNLYGPTEDTTYSTYTLVPRGGEVTIGKPLPNTQAYILDENRQPLPMGVPGELYLAGDGLARGYFGREDLTRQRFVPCPFSREAEGRMYRTGDLAKFLPDGNIQYLGRLDNQVKLRGFRIELEEIEAALLRHPSVQSAVVMVREDSPGDKQLVAYVVPAGKGTSAERLKDAVRSRLPEFMVPSFVVQVSKFPLSPNGKINRRMLPAPEQSAPDSKASAPPRDELEAALLEIWRDVLGVSNVGIRDNFFELGGHSLKAARLLTEVEQATGRELPLSALFRNATVESLARMIREDHGSGDSVVLEIQRGEAGSLPFFAIVPPGEESLGYAMLARHMGPELTVYKIQGKAPVLAGKRPYSEKEMRGLTAEYIAAMRSVQLHGPYCLGGLCDGTHIAEQMVLSLEEQGEAIALFAIFDTWVLQHSQVRWLWKIEYYRQRLREMKSLSLSERLASYKRTAKNKVGQLTGSQAARTDWQQAYWPEPFTPRRFRAPVVLFKRPKQPFYYVDDPLMGWGVRSEGGVEVHEVDFHHAEILREPQVRIFGKHLAKCIRSLTGHNSDRPPISADRSECVVAGSTEQARETS